MSTLPSIDAAVAAAVAAMEQAALTPVERVLYTTQEAAEALAVSRSMVYTLVRRHGLPSLRVGSEVRIPVQGLRAWVDAHVEATTPNQQGGAS